MAPRRNRSISGPIIYGSASVALTVALLVGWIYVILKNQEFTQQWVANFWLLVGGIVSLVAITTVLILFSVFLARQILENRRQVTFIDSVTQHAVRLQVDGLLGTTALGHYAVMSYVVIAGGAVVFSLGTPLLRPMAEQYASGRTADFVRTVFRLAGLGALLGLAGVAFAVVFGEGFLDFVFGDAFVAHADVFPWVMAAGALHFVLNALMHAVNAAQRRRAQPWIYVAALVLTLLAGWAWIPSGGLQGAAQASALGWLAAVDIAACVLGRALQRRAG